MVLQNLWTNTYHQTIYKFDPFKGLEIMKCSNKVPKRVTHDVTRGRKPGASLGRKRVRLACKFDPHVRHIRPWRFDHEIISTAILPLPLIQEEQLSVTGESMCTKY